MARRQAKKCVQLAKKGGQGQLAKKGGQPAKKGGTKTKRYKLNIVSRSAKVETPKKHIQKEVLLAALGDHDIDVPDHLLEKIDDLGDATGLLEIDYEELLDVLCDHDIDVPDDLLETIDNLS